MAAATTRLDLGSLLLESADRLEGSISSLTSHLPFLVFVAISSAA